MPPLSAANFTRETRGFIRDQRESFTKGTMYAETCQAHRTRDQRGTPNGMFLDCEWDRTAGLYSANQVRNEVTGTEVPPHKLADHRNDGTRRSCDGNP